MPMMWFVNTHRFTRMMSAKSRVQSLGCLEDAFLSIGFPIGRQQESGRQKPGDSIERPVNWTYAATATH